MPKSQSNELPGRVALASNDKAHPQPPTARVERKGNMGTENKDGAEGGAAVGCSALVRPQFIIVRGYRHEYDEHGALVRRPVSLGEQLRGIESSLGAEPLQHVLNVTFQPAVSD